MINPQKHTDYSDTQFMEAFRTFQLAPASFNHEAHLRLAWLLITEFGEDYAIEKTCNLIKQFATHFGEENQYHETLTVASVKIIAQIQSHYGFKTFQAFKNHNAELLTDFKQVIDKYYSKKIINSFEAKNSYIQPDLKPFY